MAFYFAWADATETTFGTEHHREDEDVFGLVIQHDEGQFPTAEIEIRNPRVGLLGPGRKVWAWIAWDDGSTVTPLFFGRLVGIPDNMLGEACTLRFVARPAYYYTLKQAYAQSLKVRPFYDPLFISAERRDDADAILEGYSALWHIDRVTHAVNTSDVLLGEDGTEVFTADDVPYDSVSISVDQPPLEKVQVTATVQWDQTYSGFVNIGTRSFVTYSGDGILSDWPKPLTNLGDGWTAALATAIEVYGVDKAETVTTSTQWQNQEKKHRNGDVLSVSSSETTPVLPGGGISVDTVVNVVPAVLDPFAKDIDGDPAPINRPASGNIQTTYVPLWRVNTNLIVRYDATRGRGERVILTVSADTQKVITDDGTPPEVEKIDISGGNVGMPISNVSRWSTIAGQAVTLGQVVFPDSWTGASSAQICTVAGTTGLAPPAFSDLEGFTATDGTAEWTSLGGGSDSGVAPDWQSESHTPRGTVILPKPPLAIKYEWLVAQGRIEVPKAGVTVNTGTIVETSAGFQQCITSGTTATVSPTFASTVGATTTDGDVVWQCMGLTLPSGDVFYIATTAGVSGDVLPAFNTAAGDTTEDGTVVWTSLGSYDVPIGAASRAAYFPTDRGSYSLEYLLCVARARLRLRARAVRISFDVPWTRALGLSCRKNATLNDPRLPGGIATGKITGYALSAAGDSGELKGSITIGCSVGNGTDLTLLNGSPTYVEAGYVDDGYQYTGDQIAAADDIGYTPPLAGVDPDPLVFPLTRSAAVKREMVHGSLEDQATAIRSVLAAQALPSQVAGTDYAVFAEEIRKAVQASKMTVAEALKQNPIWLELELASLSGGPFEGVYSVTSTPLAIPKSIDLSAVAA